MSKSNTPASKRNASLDRLSKLGSMMDSPSAPGQEQAAVALKKNKPGEEKAAVAQTPKRKAKPKRVEKAQNMGLSLHPADQERILKIEEAVRKAGIKGRPSTSLLIKLAIASFDASKVNDLSSLFEQLEAQDGRRKK